MTNNFQFPFFVSLFILTACSDFQEYKPLVSTEQGLVTNQELLTDEHIEHLIQVLDYYGEEWKEKNGKIYISSRIDEETMWNYTIKANDPEWLSRIKKNKQ